MMTREATTAGMSECEGRDRNKGRRPAAGLGAQGVRETIERRRRDVDAVIEELRPLYAGRRRTPHG